LEVVYRQWRGVLSMRLVLLSCKLMNKCFKKKVRFLFGQTAYKCTTSQLLHWFSKPEE
jgi:hypothetical protein